MISEIRLSIIIVIIISVFVGCTTKSMPISATGEWTLETITSASGDKNGEIIAVGKAYDNYDDFNGQKKDSLANFNEDGTLQILGLEEDLYGKYYIDNELSNKDAIIIKLEFNNETKIIATYGIRQYQDSKEVGSLIFTLDGNTYSYLKQKDI